MDVDALITAMRADPNVATEVSKRLRDHLDYAALRADTMVKEVAERISDGELDVGAAMAALRKHVDADELAKFGSAELIRAISKRVKNNKSTDRDVTQGLLNADLLDFDNPDLREAISEHVGRFDSELLLALNRLLHARDQIDATIQWRALRHAMRTAGCSGPFDSQIVGALI